MLILTVFMSMVVVAAIGCATDEKDVSKTEETVVTEIEKTDEKEITKESEKITLTEKAYEAELSSCHLPKTKKCDIIIEILLY